MAPYSRSIGSEGGGSLADEPHAAWTEAPPKSESIRSAQCRNCGVSLAGAFCTDCGQRRQPDQLTIGGLTAEAVDGVFNLNSGFLHTLLALAQRPGMTIREYVNGRTAPYTNPFKYLLVCAGAAALAYIQLGLYSTQFSQLDQALGSNPSDAVVELRAQLARYFNLFMVLSVPFLALFSRAIFRRSHHNLAEHLVFNVYVFAQQNVIFLLMVPVGLLSGGTLLNTIYMITAFVYYCWACATFFRVSVLEGS